MGSLSANSKHSSVDCLGSYSIIENVQGTIQTYSPYENKQKQTSEQKKNPRHHEKFSREKQSIDK
jgi:hypothetical protein